MAGKALKTNTAGNTLWIEVNTNDGDNGLTINAGAPIIVVQDVVDEDTKVVLETKVEIYSNFNAAFKALANNANFKGQISAVLNEKGTAEYVVLNSATPYGVEVDDGTPATPAGYSATVNVALRTVTVEGPDAWTPDAVIATAVNALADAGYEVTNMNTTVSPWVFTAKNVNSGTDGINFTVSMAK